MTFINSFPHLTHRKCITGSLYVQWSNWFWLDHCKHVNHMKISNDLQMRKATHAGHAYGALTTQDHRTTQDDLRAWWLVKGHNGAKLRLWVACWRYACSCIFQCEETRIVFYHTWRTWYLNPAHDDIDIYNIYWCSFQLQIHHQNYLYQYFHGLRKSSLHLQNAAESLDKLLMMACSRPSLISSSNVDRSFYKMQPYYQQNTTIFLFSTLHHSTHPGFRCLQQILRPSSNTQRRRLNIGLRNFLKHLQCLCDSNTGQQRGHETMTRRGHTTTTRTRDAEDMRRGQHATTAHRNDAGWCQQWRRQMECPQTAGMLDFTQTAVGIQQSAGFRWEYQGES